MFWKAFQFLRNKAAVGDPVAQQDLFGLFADFAEYMGHQAPSFHPVFTAGGVGLQYAFSQTPIDTFRGQAILTEDEMKAAVTAAGAGPARQKLLAWSFQHFGGGIIWKFHPGDVWSTEFLDSPKDFILGAPVLSNVTSRWVRRSRYGETETLTKAMQRAGQPAAIRRIEQRSEVGQAIREWESLQPWQQTDAWRMTKAREIALSTDPELRRDKKAFTERIQAVAKQIKIGVVRGGPDPYAEKLVIPGMSMEEKAVAVDAARAEMSAAAYRRWYAELRKQKIISEPFHKYLQKNRKELVH